MKISYEPLFNYIEKRGLSINSIHKAGVYGANAAQQIRNNEPVSLRIIAEICGYLDVPIEQVVKVVPNSDD